MFMTSSLSEAVSSGTVGREYRIALTDYERCLADAINLEDDWDCPEAHEIYLANARLIPELLAALAKRGAMPSHWLKYWTDPACNPGRIRASRQGLFERNGCMGEDIYTHPNFVRHLRYLLLGCELTRHLRETFLKKAGNPRWISSRDAIDLGKFARKLARENGLAAYEATEEFLKLALESGFTASAALTLREAVSQLR
ncbi:hypothetical protein [Novosphingobium capsulatum]|uniref:hypothetical protein n=1 Tax=Novosphingobium capsulatum TaxID=13688 RepID=UPI0007893AE4|nr:hypothetical protein [Novosphingobium capsulatum]WQD91402.1 hypothetical protein U0041_10240 [Novosphingobium capsulatum]